MILKSKDTRAEDLAELNRLLTLPLTPRQRSLIEQELRLLQAGERNEESAAYFLNFHLKDSKNWMVIHDLRLEHRGRVAQIDHLVINRFLRLYVLESKSFSYGIKITPEGEFMRWDGKGYQGIESPIEQNNRHIFLLEKAIADRKLAPTRLGFSIPISCRNVVLISPKSKIIRPEGGIDNASVIKADAFWTHAQKEVDKMSVVEMGKLIGTDTVRDFGERLARLHRPATGTDYMAKFGIKEQVVASPPPPAYTPVQASAPSPAPGSGRKCDNCGVEVENKVVAFCRFNKTKLGGKTLCRDCQQRIG
jgi:hypothetical protein